MAIIYTYPTVVPEESDILLGTEKNATLRNPTKNFEIGEIAKFIIDSVDGTSLDIPLFFDVTDPITGLTQFSFFRYRQSIVQKALRSWDIESVDRDGNKYSVPVNPQNIANLNPKLGLALYERYNAITSYTDLDMGNL